MRTILQLNAKTKEEALDALYKAMISLEEDIGPNDRNINITVSIPDERSFKFFTTLTDDEID